MNNQAGKRGKRLGTGNVIVNGKVMTTDMYKNAVLKTLKSTDKWMSTPEIINFASKMEWCEPDDWTTRKAVAHPIYRILTYMMEEKTFHPIIRMKGEDNKWTYRIKEPNAIYINGELVKVVRKPK